MGGFFGGPSLPVGAQNDGERHIEFAYIDGLTKYPLSEGMQ